MLRRRGGVPLVAMRVLSRPEINRLKAVAATMGKTMADCVREAMTRWQADMRVRIMDREDAN